jgi:hypothetical protein
MIKREIAIREYLLFVEAWIFLALARSIIILFPFRIVAQILGRIDGSTNDINSETSLEKFKLTAIGTAILRASRRSPWRTKCLESALAARFMLRRRKEKYIVFLGVNTTTNDQKSLAAHAWLISNGHIITGGGNATKVFKIIGKFHG